MFTWKRSVALHLAQTRLPKSAYEHIDLGSEIFDLPPSYRTTEATIVATPDKKKGDPGARVRGHYWIDSPAGEAIKRLCFTEDGALLENASVGTAARRAAPCKISVIVRKSLEQRTLLRPGHALCRPQGVQLYPNQCCSQIWRFSCIDAGIARRCVFGSRLPPQD